MELAVISEWREDNVTKDVIVLNLNVLCLACARFLQNYSNAHTL
jgi:hypothetical protein